MDRVTSVRIGPRNAGFDMVRDLMLETGLLTRKLEFDEYVDSRFADKASIQTAWEYQPGSAKAEWVGTGSRENSIP